MRQLQKLKQYKRIYDRFGFSPVSTTIPELAEILICSDRHTKNLLTQFSDNQWLIWKPHPGRGQKSFLQCIASTTELSEMLLQELLLNGDYQTALKLAEGNASLLKYIMSPFLGRKGHEHLPVLQIFLHEKLGELIPALDNRRSERHIISSIYSGLSRFVDNNIVPDLAYRWRHDGSGIQWDFFLHNDLHWHNGQPIYPSQLLESLKLAFSYNSVKYVSSISLLNSYIFRICLTTPDFLLPARLAFPLFRLTHPQSKQIGCGPFRLVVNDARYTRLEKHPHYHLSHPLIYAIELFNFTDSPEREHHDFIRIREKKETDTSCAVVRERVYGNGFAFVTFSNNVQLTVQQKQFLIALCQEYISLKYSKSMFVVPTRKVLLGIESQRYTGKQYNDFPDAIDIAVYNSQELVNIADWLVNKLKKVGCKVTMKILSCSEWYEPQAFEGVTMILGNISVKNDVFMLFENWFFYDPLWSKILKKKERRTGYKLMERYAVQPEKHHQNILQCIRYLLRRHILVPLLRYCSIVEHSTSIQGVEMDPDGWFDFSKVWFNSDIT